MSQGEISLLVLGFAGQTLFFMRFFVQWLYSEKHRRSMIPTSFWYFSIGGSSLLLIYAILRKDIVFIVGQSTGFLIYFRNLRLLAKERRRTAAAVSPELE